MESHLQGGLTASSRTNIEVCLEFVKEHGYPAGRYNFLVDGGVLEVLTQHEIHQRFIDAQPGAYSIVSAILRY